MVVYTTIACKLVRMRSREFWEWVSGHFSNISPGQAAIITALMALVGAIFAATRPGAAAAKRERLLFTKRGDRVKHAKDRVDFWKVWLETIKPIALPTEIIDLEKLARSQLLLASDEMEIVAAGFREKLREHKDSVSKWERHHESVKNLPAWRQLLLLYVPARAKAWVPRIAIVVLLVFVVFALSGSVVERRDNDRRISQIDVQLVSPDLNSKTRADLQTERLVAAKISADFWKGVSFTFGFGLVIYLVLGALAEEWDRPDFFLDY